MLKKCLEKYDSCMDWVFARPALIMLLLFPFFKNCGFDQVPYLSFVCNALIALEAFVFLMAMIGKRDFTPFSAIILALQLWIYVLAPLISRCSPPSLYYLCEAVGILGLFHEGFSRCPGRFLRWSARLFAGMSILNLAVMLLPGVLLAGIYPFGMRTGIPLIVVPGLLVCALADAAEKKPSLCTALCALSGIGAILISKVGTGILELAAAAILLVLLCLTKPGKLLGQKLKVLYAALLVFLFDFSMSLLGQQNFLMVLFSNLLHKEVTLSHRTEIWAIVVQHLSESPIAGFGENNTIYFDFYGFMMPAHNQWLHAAMESGYVGMAIFIAAVFFSCFYAGKHCKAWWYGIWYSFAIAILIASIVEIQTYVPFIYAVFELPFLLTKDLTGENGDLLYEKS